MEKETNFELSPPAGSPQRKEKQAINPTFGNYKLQNQANDFNAEQQFKSSLMEVLGTSTEKEPNQNSQRLYTM